MAEVTAALVRRVLPTKKRLYRIAEQAGFDANRIQDIYLPVVGGLALPWWALNGVKYKLPAEAVAVPVKIPQVKLVKEWRLEGWVSVEKKTGKMVHAISWRYQSGQVTFHARPIRTFEAQQEGLHFTFDGREILLLVPWSDILLVKQPATCPHCGQVLTKC